MRSIMALKAQPVVTKLIDKNATDNLSANNLNQL